MTTTLEKTSREFMLAAERSTTLYDLSADYLRVLDLIEEAPDDEALEAELDRIAGKLTQKAESIAGLIAHFEGVSAMRKAEAQRLKERSDTDQKRADRLRAYLLRNMQALGTEHIETVRFSLKVRTNPPAVQVLEEQLVPAEYIRTVVTTSVDKRSILEDFKQTGEIPHGVDITRAQRLEIK